MPLDTARQNPAKAIRRHRARRPSERESLQPDRDREADRNAFRALLRHALAALPKATALDQIESLLPRNVGTAGLQDASHS